MKEIVMEKSKETYETPALLEVEFKTEGLICESTRMTVTYEEEDL